MLEVRSLQRNCPDFSKNRMIFSLAKCTDPLDVEAFSLPHTQRQLLRAQHDALFVHFPLAERLAQVLFQKGPLEFSSDRALLSRGPEKHLSFGA